MSKLKVYLIGRIAPEYHERTENLAGMLTEFEVFIPHKHNPFNTPGNRLPSEVAELDYDAMDDSSVGIISPPVGKDCCAEIGYFSGKRIPIVIYVDEFPDIYGRDYNFLYDWMVKAAISGVAVTNESLGEVIKRDPILCRKDIKLVRTPEEFQDFIFQIIDNQRKAVLAELERQVQEDMSQPLLINGSEARIITGTSMADLYEQCSQQNLAMMPLPQLAKARINSDLSSYTGRMLWRYNWMTNSALARLRTQDGADYGVFTHLNPFGSDEKRIEAYKRPLKSGGIPIDDEAQQILDMSDGESVIALPFEQIRNSPRGVIKTEEILCNGCHPVALGAFRNRRELLQEYLRKYEEIMSTGPFNPMEMGIWFSEDEAFNTMRPFELGDSGIGIYNRNLKNKEYRTIGLKKQVS